MALEDLVKEVLDREDKKDEQIKISPKNRGRGRKRKPVNDEKLESLEKDNLSPPKQRKDDDVNVLQVWNLVCLFSLHFFLFLCCTAVHFLFLSQGKMNSTHEDKSSALVKDIDMPSEQEQDKSLNTSIGKEVEAVLEESEEKRMLSKKEREIVILKRKLQEKEVYGSTTVVRNELK